ncbi:hypothetical protein ACV1DR_18400 [Aeromonas jandaei]
MRLRTRRQQIKRRRESWWWHSLPLNQEPVEAGQEPPVKSGGA